MHAVKNVWSPEHDTPRRARAYLLTDADVTGMAARYAPARPPLDAISRQAVTADDEDGPEGILQSALSRAPVGTASISIALTAASWSSRESLRRSSLTTTRPYRIGASAAPPGAAGSSNG